jgi:serine protease Do
MKPLTAWILSSAIVLPSLAAETPTEKNPHPAAEAGMALEKPPAPAFLGVGTTTVPDILFEHLGLKPGEGVMIESTQEESPATQAGIKVGDIITRISGKPVESTLDLGEKIRAHQPGDKIRIDVIQKGKPAALDVTLVERPADLIDPAMLELLGNPGAGNLHNRVDELQRRVQGLQLQMLNLAPGNPQMLGGGINVNGGGELQLRDNEGSVGYKTDGDGTEITVRDHNEKVVWAGPWDTDQDKAAAPENVRRRIERFNIRPNHKGNGIQLHPGGDNGFAPPPDDHDPVAPQDDDGDGDDGSN